jgi:hypothetical protein
VKKRKFDMDIGHAARLMLVISLAFAAAGCNQPDFPKYETLGDLRILTVIADLPEANPGDTVTFTPVLSDLNGQGRTISYTVQACIDPGVGIGLSPACTDPDPASLLTGTMVISPGASQTYTGPVSSFSLIMPKADTIFASRRAADQFNGVAYLVFYSVSVPGNPPVDSFLRVIVSSSDKTQKNRNPVITSVDLNDSPISGLAPIPVAPSNFRVTTPPGSAETFEIIQKDGSLTTQTEELINTWFIADGTLDFSRTIGSSENSWTPPKSRPTNRGMVMLVVTRDGRGGAAFQKVELN